MFKMFVTVFLILSISLLTQSAPAADPAPAPCVEYFEEVCEPVLAPPLPGCDDCDSRVVTLCRNEIRRTASCFEK